MQVKRVETQSELNDAWQVRIAVFVDEQGVPPAVELDEYEASSEHIIVYNDDKLPVGTGRLRMVDGVAKLERICILAAYRQYGLGRKIVAALEEIASGKGLTTAKLHGQSQAEHFYHKLGYQTKSAVFVEDGIPHVLMTKSL